MPSDKPDRVEKWRKAAANATTLTTEAFADLIVENGLRAVGPFEGMVYAALETDDGFDMYRAPGKFGRSVLSTTTTANPAAGAQLASITVPSNKAWRLLGLSYQVTTDANVANRVPALTFRPDGTNTTLGSAPNVPVTASITSLRVVFSVGGANGGTVATNGLLSAGIPDIVMPEGGIYVAYFYNIQAADDLTAATYTYQEFDA